ncbi:MAG: hypothetical protein KKF12_03890 [Proteobacteria bacterium]|nr:hypothetical protein [Desulfobacula sp.]MBU4129940.1 hypothetical protein [Pseudomonadota bacterium]
MTTLHPQGESLKKAILWISEKRKNDPGINLGKLVDQAAFQFDLSPKDSEFLLRFVNQEKA